MSEQDNRIQRMSDLRHFADLDLDRASEALENNDQLGFYDALRRLYDVLRTMEAL